MDQARPTALITGASSGIGVELARDLARRGYDLVIVARREARLIAVQQQLEQAYDVVVSPLVADLDDPTGADQLFERVTARGDEIAFLANNAGFGHYGLFATQSLEEINSMIQVNVVSLTRLCRLFGERMCQQGHGYILNVASYGALQPIPRYSVYSGAKAYVVALSQALQHEMRKSGVRVSCLCPGFTATEFHQVARHQKTKLMRLTTMDAETVAQAGVRGALVGRTVVVPGLWYRANALLARLLPRRLSTALAAASVKQ